MLPTLAILQPLRCPDEPRGKLLACSGCNLALRACQWPIIFGADSREGYTFCSKELCLHQRRDSLVADLMSQEMEFKTHRQTKHELLSPIIHAFDDTKLQTNNSKLKALRLAFIKAADRIDTYHNSSSIHNKKVHC